MPMRHWGSLSVSADAPDEALRALGALLRERGYRFTTITPASHQRVNDRAANARGLCLEDVIGWSRPFAEQDIAEDIFLLLQSAGVLERTDGLWRSRVRASTIG